MAFASKGALSPALERANVQEPKPPPVLSDIDRKYAKNAPKAGQILPAYIVRGLNDKVYDKRKQAALDIQRLTKELLAAGDDDRVDQLIYILKHEFCYSSSGNAQKGGLIGLAGMATALAQESGQHLQDLIPPVLGSFSDPDSRVRYYACEALYNIAKAHRARILPYFNELFDSLATLAGDPDKDVRNGEELLDRLIKDIVLESTSFHVAAFVPLLRERIYTHNPFVRQFIVSWIQALDNVPAIELLDYLHEFLDGLFLILSDKSEDIRRMAANQLAEFLREIRATGLNYAMVMPTLVQHSASSDQLTGFTAIAWLKEFLVLAGSDLLAFHADLLRALLPALAHVATSTRDMAKTANQELMRLYMKLGVSEASAGTVTVVLDHVQAEAIETRVAALRWLLLFWQKQPSMMYGLLDTLMAHVVPALRDRNEEVALLAVEVLAEFCAHADTLASASGSHSHPVPEAWSYLQDANDNNHKSQQQMCPSSATVYKDMLRRLLETFAMDEQLLERRGALIICQLCALLSAERVFVEMAGLLVAYEDREFVQHVVQAMATILLSAKECRPLRQRLKSLGPKDNRVLFVTLYLAWSYNAVATLSLCLLAQAYQHAHDLLMLFSDMDVTVALLMDLDRLVKLLESPVFTYLRLQLLSLDGHPYLGQCLYGLLMLLPQGQAFRTLHTRLHALPPPHPAQDATSTPAPAPTCNKDIALHFDGLLAYFKQVQTQQHDSGERTSEMAID